MSYTHLHPTIQQIAETHLTPAQLVAWKLELNGNGTRRIALLLDISRGSVVDRLDNAYRTLRRNGITQDEHGNWHHMPTQDSQEALSGARSPKMTQDPNHHPETLRKAHT
jgi:DNA-binding CsgD family transcriptional regulator